MEVPIICVAHLWRSWRHKPERSLWRRSVRDAEKLVDRAESAGEGEGGAAKEAEAGLHHGASAHGKEKEQHERMWKRHSWLFFSPVW